MTHLDETQLQLSEFVDKHNRIALMFSAGKDSGACLKLLRPYIYRVFVIWANPGRAYPETLDYMKRIAGTVPPGHFIVAPGNQPNYVREHGYPADTVPFEATLWGHVITRSSGPRLLHVTQCCGVNMWAPMQQAIAECGATGVIQGQKECDEWRSPGTNGARLGMGEYHYPLFKWTNDEIIDYLGDDIPPSYNRGLKASLDCMTCTAYLRHNPGRLRDLEQQHPEVYAEIRPVLRWMRMQATINAADLMTETPP